MSTILTIDDSRSVREMVAQTLKSAGYDVVEAIDGEDGLAKAKAQPIQMVLTDQNMPKMDGLTLVRNLRLIMSYKKVPILMLTTESSNAMKQKGKEAGATGWLVKPFNPETLLAVVKKVLS